MKPTNSATGTIPREQHSPTGMQGGEHGLATRGSIQPVALPTPTPQAKQLLLPGSRAGRLLKIVSNAIKLRLSAKNAFTSSPQCANNYKRG